MPTAVTARLEYMSHVIKLHKMIECEGNPEYQLAFVEVNANISCCLLVFIKNWKRLR